MPGIPAFLRRYKRQQGISSAHWWDRSSKIDNIQRSRDGIEPHRECGKAHVLRGMLAADKANIGLEALTAVVHL